MKRVSIILALILLMPGSPFIYKARSVVTNDDYTSSPPFLAPAVPPMVMMLMGRDHKLYYEAYNDASDIDGDGQLDIGYKHSIDYYGYFDAYKCYDYDSTGTAKFVPSGTSTDKYCTGSNSGKWSGNFLNWLSTSRIDALRKVLYGGYRSTDSSSTTVLAGQPLPQDAHSWGKELSGSDTSKLTPFTDPSGSGTLPTTAVSWGTAGTSQKILLVTYDDSTSGLYGNNHTDLVNSYSVCNYSSYNYIGDFTYTGINPANNHIDTGNFFLVTEFYVSPNQGGVNQGGDWNFAVDGDDGEEVEIRDDAGAVVTWSGGASQLGWYGSHGTCGATCTTHNGTITLTPSKWYRMIVRHRENTGNDGVKVSYRSPNQGDTTWRVFGSTTNTTRKYYFPFRAPNIINAGTGLAEVIRLKTTSFITTGEPAYDASGTGTVTCSAGRHLFCMTSLADGATPVIRLLQNKSNRIWEWASKERPVCDTSLGVPTDYSVRVEVCKDSVGLESNCKTYPNSPPTKPSGLFQKFGESTEKVCSKSFKTCNTNSDCSGSPETCIDKGQMFFGLMTGSYTNNLSGGVLRWNLDSITHAVDNRNVGIIKTSSDNMIKTLNNLKVTGFDFGSQYYNQNCGWFNPPHTQNQGECRMWGNPIGEMMYEAERYFAGKGTPLPAYSSGTYAVGTDDRVLGLTNSGENPTADNNWTDPYQKFPSCSKPFMIVLSDVNPSYDSDQLPGVDSDFGTYTTSSADLAGINVKTLTDSIGAAEGINGTNAFIGQVDAAKDGICSSKAITSLGSVRGLCAEEPTKQGSYYSAGVAYYGKKDFSANNGGRPNITTYSVGLISPVPEIKLDVNGKTVKIVPIGKSVSGCAGVATACANNATLSYNVAGHGLSITPNVSSMYCPSNQIVDFYVETLSPTHGNFRVNYEDEEYGADHDMDSIVQYTYDVSGDDVTIGLNSSYASGCIDQILGLVITGTTDDGVFLPVRDTDSGAADGDTPALIAGMPTTWSKTFTASSSAPSATLLKDPLWYAAKWGGFEDQNGNGIPDLQEEWDKDGDGLPDTYFLISNPLKMEQQLTKVFSDILKRSASGTSVSILATSAEGEGALYQSYFYPSKVMDDGTKREWLGYCRGLFLDSFGNLRDDCSSSTPGGACGTPDSKLVFKKDNIVRLKLDTATSEVKADIYTDANEDGKADTPSTPDRTVGVDDLSTLWEAGAKLALRDKSTRTVYTFIDSNTNGLVDAGEVIYVSTANAVTLQPYLNAADVTEATNIINFTRGTPVSGYRKRCLPITGATTEAGCGTGERSWALGDIVYSTPTVVSGTREQYDLIYGGKAANYSTFKKLYNNRRHVIYVGANDGMLHAFNAGVYTAGNDTTTTDTEHGWFIPNPLSGNGWGSVGIGDELWAFVPYDNLPHLKWLTKSDYSHVYYVDLKPKPSDVQIFCDAGTGVTTNCVDGQGSVSHPGGWGTILIAGMKFGGGDIVAGGKTFRSSYYALDVTDPEKAPKLLWRFTDSNLGFTTSYPGIIHINGTPDKWFMVVGSGPGPNNTEPPAKTTYSGQSTQQGRIYIVNLLTGQSSMTFSKLGVNNSGTAIDSNTFMGDPTVVDGDLDFTADVVYIGSAIATTSGKVFRITTANNTDPTTWELSVLTNPGKPLLVGPSVSKDALNNFWVYFGTGRLMSTDDKLNADQQTLYGIKDACWKRASGDTCTTTYTTATLLNSTNLVVCASGKVYDSSVAGQNCSAPSTTFTSLLSSARSSYSGWFKRISAPGTSPSERVLSRSVVLGGIAMFTSFTPNPDPCSLQGDSRLHALYYETGTAYNKSVIGTSDVSSAGPNGTGRISSGSGGNASGGTAASGEEIIYDSGSLGKGLPTTVGVAVGKTTKGFIQTSTGTIVEVAAQPALGVRSGAASWRETTEGGGTSEVETIYKHITK